MEIKTILCTCHCCPSQWEAYTEKKEAIYIRYRWGQLTIHISKPNGTIRDAINKGKTLYSEQIGEKYDGVITLERVMEIIDKEEL